jgi:rubrerythrin
MLTSSAIIVLAADFDPKYRRVIMTGEQDTTLGALQAAIKMEIDGKEFYLKASQTSRNDLGKQLFTKLAGEEDIHRQVFERIYHDISTEQGWPEKAFKGDGGSSLRTVFAKALESMDKNVSSMTTEMDAIQTAMTMENKTFDFYKERSDKARYPAEKQFYEELSVQEEEHHRILLDYYEFLKDPSAWFVKSEHHGMDG